MNSFDLSVTVNQDVGHTWEYYFNQIRAWWPKEYFSSPRTKRFIIETYIGGKVYEDFGEGDGLVWGDVIGVDYLTSLEIRGNLNRSFGGPAISFEKFLLKSVQNGTELSYSCDFVGNVHPSTINSLKKGWQELLHTHFKHYCNTRE